MGNKSLKLSDGSHYVEMNFDSIPDSEGKGTNQQQHDQCWPKLSYVQRAIGWILCSVLGWILSFIGTLVLTFSDKYATFAVLYSVGQLINIVGSCFLSTPKGQWKAMSKKQRRVASLIYITSIFITLIMAVAVRVKPLIFISLTIQMISYYWYSLTFLPCGERILRKTCCSCWQVEGEKK